MNASRPEIRMETEPRCAASGPQEHNQLASENLQYTLAESMFRGKEKDWKQMGYSDFVEVLDLVPEV